MERFNKEKLLSLSTEERIIKINTFVWVGYSQANDILREFSRMMATPKKDRMPGRLLIGEPNNGKTVILKKIFSLHPPTVDDATGQLKVPVLYFRVSEIDEKTFYVKILQALFAPINASEDKHVRASRALHLIRKADVRFIIIDEFHSILNTGNMNQQRHFLVTLKEFANELQLPIVLCGTLDSRNAIDSDPNVQSRFDEIELRNWEYGQEYLRLLMSFEKILPLKEDSYLHHSEIAQKIFAMSGGIIGEIKSIIDRSATLALDRGRGSEHLLSP